MTHVDLTDPSVRQRLSAAGIRWRLRDFNLGYLDIPAAKAHELGITKADLAKEERAEVKVDAAREKAATAEEKRQAALAEVRREEVEAKAKADAKAAAAAAATPTPEQLAAAKAAELARKAK